MSIVAIKALDNYVLDVLAAPYGGPIAGRDAHGEFFSAQTKFHEDKYPLAPAVYYHGFNVDGTPQGSPIYLGKSTKRWVESDGVWYKVLLDSTIEEARKVWMSAKNGMARASSGSIAHLVRKTTGGFIKEWPIVELSIFDTEDGKQPANQYAVAIPATKAIYQKAELELVLPEEDKAIMNPDDVKQLVVSAVADAIGPAVIAALKSEDIASRRLSTPNIKLPYQMKFGELAKFDNLPHGTLAFMIGVLEAAKRKGESRGSSTNSLKALAVRMVSSKEDYTAKKRGLMAMKSAGMPLKADELNNSNLTGYGKEWISVVYSTALWERIRLSARIAGYIPTLTVPKGADSVVIPLQGTPPRFYTVAQATNLESNPGRITRTQRMSKMSTGSRTIHVAKMGAGAIYTGELEEDSMIDWVAELEASIQEEGGHVLDHVILDGDTRITAENINCKGEVPKDEPFLLFDGVRKVALVTNTDNSFKAEKLHVNIPVDMMMLMGVAGRNAMQKDKIILVPDATTYWRMKKLPEVMTQQTFASPTIEGGELTALHGYTLVGSPNMHRADEDYGLLAGVDGHVYADHSKNTAASMAAIRPDQWRLGMKRGINLHINFDAGADATEVVANMRVGLVCRDHEAAALVYGMEGYGPAPEETPAA